MRSLLKKKNLERPERKTVDIPMDQFVSQTVEPQQEHSFLGPRWKAPLSIFAACAAIYVVSLGGRIGNTAVTHPHGSHYVHLANSYLHGQLSNVGGQSLGIDDEALYRGTWFISFPPLPALLILPLVAVFGLHAPQALFWAIIAAFAPALLWVLLGRLRELDRVDNPQTTDYWLVALFALGTPFFFTAVQGTVWFAAHVVATCLITIYLIASLQAHRPILAGSALGLAFMTRPTTLLAGVYFLVEAINHTSSAGANASRVEKLRHIDWKQVARKIFAFCIPVLCIGLVAMWVNYARFENPFEFGHRYLQVMWHDRIQRWGLFHYHYLGKNLAVFFASLPWITCGNPCIRITTHGLALWFTTPCLLWVLRVKKIDLATVGLIASIVLVALLNLLYQNTGWEQFGYRFALDYMPMLFVLLALVPRLPSKLFIAFACWSIFVNAFGAATFGRAFQYYERDPAIIFQPD